MRLTREICSGIERGESWVGWCNAWVLLGARLEELIGFGARDMERVGAQQNMNDEAVEAFEHHIHVLETFESSRF
jgi:hypothetical protein